ncbi:hypothetical protein ACLMJK_004972 [Lecanora helva]
MSFGFSVADFISLARMSLRVYNKFKEAPKVCEAFRKEMLLFHQVLCNTAILLQDQSCYLTEKDKTTLAACTESCKELFYIKIYDAAGIPKDVQFSHGTEFQDTSLKVTEANMKLDCDWGSFRGWRQIWAEKKFAQKIPKLQQEVSAHIQILTASCNIMTQSHLTAVMASQNRLETYHEDVENSQARLEAASERIEKTQNRMEQQLQAILASKSRHQTPIMGRSLNASSPEGRETWMNLGRLLRAEGITPDLIKKNRDILIRTMKSTIQESVQSGTPESYRTAFESPTVNGRGMNSGSSLSREWTGRGEPSLGFPTNELLGSAPPRGATFTEEFLRRQTGDEAPLDKSENVKEGMECLLLGSDQESSVNCVDDDFETSFLDLQVNEAEILA